jgi:hypothetical protein
VEEKPVLLFQERGQCGDRNRRSRRRLEEGLLGQGPTGSTRYRSPPHCLVPAELPYREGARGVGRKRDRETRRQAFGSNCSGEDERDLSSRARQIIRSPRPRSAGSRDFRDPIAPLAGSKLRFSPLTSRTDDPRLGDGERERQQSTPAAKSLPGGPAILVSWCPVFSRAGRDRSKVVASRGMKKGSDVKRRRACHASREIGTPSPDDFAPANESANVTDTRMTVAGQRRHTPERLPFRLFLMKGRVEEARPDGEKANNRKHGPTRSQITSGRTRRRAKKTRSGRANRTHSPAKTRSGSIGRRRAHLPVLGDGRRRDSSAGLRFRKSKISWPPGSRPVGRSPETGVCAGMVGIRGEYPPRCLSGEVGKTAGGQHGSTI